MAIPSVGQLLQPTLDALHAAGRIAAIPAITDEVFVALPPSPEEATGRDARHNMTKDAFTTGHSTISSGPLGCPVLVWVPTQKGYDITLQIDAS